MLREDRSVLMRPGIFSIALNETLCPYVICLVFGFTKILVWQHITKQPNTSCLPKAAAAARGIRRIGTYAVAVADNKTKTYPKF